MLKYLSKRIGRSILTLFVIVTLVFCLLRLMPVEGYFANYEKMTEAQIQAGLQSMGLLDPLPVQIGRFWWNALHGDLGVIQQNDVILALSNSGQTDELLRFIPMVLHMNVPIIGMSGNPQSLLAKYATAHLLVKVEKEACPLNLAPTSSTTAALVMGDALAMQDYDFVIACLALRAGTTMEDIRKLAGEIKRELR